MNSKLGSIEKKKIPIIVTWKQLGSLPELDKTKTIDTLQPLYQDGKVIAFMKMRRNSYGNELFWFDGTTDSPDKIPEVEMIEVNTQEAI